MSEFHITTVQSQSGGHGGLYSSNVQFQSWSTHRIIFGYRGFSSPQGKWWDVNLDLVKPENSNYSNAHYSIQHLKVKQSHYRPGQVMKFPGGWGSKILRNRHMKVARLSAPRTGRLYLQVLFLVLISVRGWVDPKAIMRAEGLCQRKIATTPSGIDPATLRFVTQCLNHCATACPQSSSYYSKFINYRPGNAFRGARA
jgi:hypothetical protein